MKKQYMKPAVEVVNVQTSHLLTASPDESFRIDKSQKIDNYDELE